MWWLEPVAYGGYKGASEAWTAWVLAVGGGAIIAGVEPEGLEAPAPERFPRDP